jgi:hypothetical protein
MAKKGKNKKKQQKKRSNKNYNKSEFQTVFCQTCLICETNCNFCYTDIYRVEPKRFINDVFNNLVDLHATYQAMGRSMKSLSIEQFQNMICKTGICYEGDPYASATCHNDTECYKAFMKQLGVTNPTILNEPSVDNLIEFKVKKYRKLYVASSRKGRKKKNKNRRVYTSYPTFFSSPNAEFQAEIQRIIYGDNNLEQDKDKELPTGTTGTADRHTEGGEP